MNFSTYIKSAKQLHNTYITNDCPVKRDVYLALCDRFGISKSPIIHSRYLEVTIFPARSPSFAAYAVSSKDFLYPESKELYLADLVDLHDSYVMTSDFEVARKFSHLVGGWAHQLKPECGFEIDAVSCNDSNVISLHSGHAPRSCFENKTKLTTDLISAMYAEMVKLKALNDAYAADRKPVSLTDFLKRTEPMSSGEKFMQSNQAPVKVKSEFVLIEDDSIFDLRPDFEAGELFYKKDGNGSWCAIQNEKQLMEKLLSGQVYYRIEKPVDWKQEVLAFAHQYGFFGVSDIVGRNDSRFLEMCRVALRATGELPDATK